MAGKSLAAVNGVQEAFVRKLVETGDAKKAATAAGLHNSDVLDLACDPLVIKRIRLEVMARLHVEILPQAIKKLDQMVKNSVGGVDGATLQYNVRNADINLCKLVLDRCGIVAPKPGEAAKPLAELSLDELHAIVTKLEAERAAAAKPVSAQEVQADPAKPLDFME